MEFSISRINTSVGIFKLSGDWSANVSAPAVTFSCAEFMGTDGWVAMKIESDAGALLLKQIEADVVRHLAP
ncbi:hypothetical protein L4C36_00010 [Photobacterium japonica]|uniref:hypothetical protein n=1 Tax=Photobacterium japonica TaxID=2910235 RepID=UPI003D0F3327